MDLALSSPACLTVHVCFPGARAAVMDNLNRQREEGRLCDLSIQVQGQVFRAHRCVLAASSPYFHDQVGPAAASGRQLCRPAHLSAPATRCC